MTFREQTLANGMIVIESFFNDWCYLPGIDIYRAKDIANSLNRWQWESKEWLTEEMVAQEAKGSALVMGGWYGLLSGMLKYHTNLRPETVDIDPLSKTIGRTLFPEVVFHTDDAFEFFMSRRNDFKWLINTSTEHMDPEDVRLMVRYKPNKTKICFQNNNMFHEDSHINCYETLDEFVESLDLKKVIQAKSLTIGEYKRWMVVGE